ncbi:roundabout homolog 1 isoform X2 [Pungitius pungitius]|uniref:roundabout homolog 1 isoform X2 n=1 Tax=Pungitius pungitius TaxID=134920 RepID=UPI002E107EF7
MKLCGGFLCSRMHVSVSIWTFPQMTSHLPTLLILSSLAVSSEPSLEDVFFSPQDQTVRAGEGVFFQCVSGESSPPASITWLKDGAPVTRGRRIQGEYGGGNQKKTSGTLHLFNVTLEDDGMYICVTHSRSLNVSKESSPAKLTVHGVPSRLQIIQGPDNITVATGTEVSMHCAVRGFPVPMVHWFKDGSLLSNGSASFSLRNNGQLLTFRNVTRVDEGSYHCEASNQRESITSEAAFLLPAEMDWSFIQQPIDLTVKRGENVSVTCRPPYSRPAAQVSWFKNNQLLTSTAHQTVLPSGDLFFHSVQADNDGSYFCRASNVQLQRFVTSRRAALTVLAPPSVTLWPRVLTVSAGARVALECQASGNPSPSMSWVKRGHSKQTGGKVVLGSGNATLHIQSARSYDEGEYVCEASNALGHSRSTAVLRVAVSPIIVSLVGQVSCRIGASAVLPCRAVGILPITYTWSKGGAERDSSITQDRRIDENGALHISSVQYSDVGEYICTAENRAGRHQRRSILAVIAEHRPADGGKQTRPYLSASNDTSKDPAASQSSDALAEQHLGTTHHPHARTQHQEATCSLSRCGSTTNRTTTLPTWPRGAAAELKMPQQSHGRLFKERLDQPATITTRPLVTQMQPPTLPPPLRPNIQSVDRHTQLPLASGPLSILGNAHSQTSAVTRDVLGTTLPELLTESQSQLALTPSGAQFRHQASDGLLTEPDSQGSSMRAVSPASPTLEPLTERSKPPVGEPNGFVKIGFYLPTPTQSPTTQTKTSHSGSITQPSLQAPPNQTQTHQVASKATIYQSVEEPTSTQVSQTEFENSGQRLHQETNLQDSPTISQMTQADPQPSFTQSLLPKFHLEPSTNSNHLPSTQPPPSSVTHPRRSQTHSEPTKTTSALPQSSPTQHPLLHSHAPLPQTETSPLQHRKPLKIQPSISTHQTSETLVVHRIDMSDAVQRNTSHRGEPGHDAKSANDTGPSEWLKRNTSQSPMTSNDQRVTQQSPSWLPLLEKHDIPIVVGVGVSLAFIFITVTFYSVVQKKEPAPTSRAAQRNVGVPVRHTDRRAAGRTYENRAFEDDGGDDDCVAVIEQSPNTSHTRARPPGPSLVTVQMEPAFEGFQGDGHLVTVETYPEPILDTEIDPPLEEVKGCSSSQPSVQLQCAEDWTGDTADCRRSPLQDSLPPPSSLPSPSPSPSPPSRRGEEEGLRSSLTLRSAEAFLAPIHHSLSITHGNSPMLLSHHVSLGLTTVAVDVHFYPAATASTSVGSTTHISSVTNSTSVAAPVFGSQVVNRQENDQSARFNQSK